MAMSDAPVMDLLDSAAGQDVRALRAVLGVSHAVMGVQRFEDALEVIAEHSLVAVNAASFSISRWERQRGVLRTLINVGQLGPTEERWPENEVYPLSDYRNITEVLQHARSHVSSVYDHDADVAGVSLLRQLEKESEMAVPVMYESEVWGELCANGTDGRRFTADDVRLLEAIAAHVSVAIGRAERFNEVSRYAYEDPLTRLANRRSLDERLGDVGDGSPALLVCDVDGLKDVNDRDGHPAGDTLLRGVAGILSDVASTYERSLVARLGGDEFCVMLPVSSLSDADEFARAASGRITRELGNGVSMCWGAAAWNAETRTGHELIAAADAALIEAKRLGPGRLWLHLPGDHSPSHGVDKRQGLGPSGRRRTDDLVRRVVRLLDQSRPPTTVAALELLAGEVTPAAGAACWLISETTDDLTGIRTVGGVLSVFDPSSGLRALKHAPDDFYPLADYPSTVAALAEGGTFLAGVDLDGSDPAEVEVLHRFGYRAILGAGLVDAQRGYLLEIYSDGDHTDLAAFESVVRVLVHYAAARVISARRVAVSPLPSAPRSQIG